MPATDMPLRVSVKQAKPARRVDSASNSRRRNTTTTLELPSSPTPPATAGPQLGGSSSLNANMSTSRRIGALSNTLFVSTKDEGDNARSTEAADGAGDHQKPFSSKRTNSAGLVRSSSASYRNFSGQRDQSNNTKNATNGAGVGGGKTSMTTKRQTTSLPAISTGPNANGGAFSPNNFASPASTTLSTASAPPVVGGGGAVKKVGVVDLTQSFAKAVGAPPMSSTKQFQPSVGGGGGAAFAGTLYGGANSRVGGGGGGGGSSSGSYHVDQHKHRLQSLTNSGSGGGSTQLSPNANYNINNGAMALGGITGTSATTSGGWGRSPPLRNIGNTNNGNGVVGSGTTPSPLAMSLLEGVATTSSVVLASSTNGNFHLDDSSLSQPPSPERGGGGARSRSISKAGGGEGGNISPTLANLTTITTTKRTRLTLTPPLRSTANDAEAEGEHPIEPIGNTTAPPPPFFDTTGPLAELIEKRRVLQSTTGSAAVLLSGKGGGLGGGIGWRNNEGRESRGGSGGGGVNWLLSDNISPSGESGGSTSGTHSNTPSPTLGGGRKGSARASTRSNSNTNLNNNNTNGNPKPPTEPRSRGSSDVRGAMLRDIPSSSYSTAGQQQGVGAEARGSINFNPRGSMGNRQQRSGSNTTANANPLSVVNSGAGGGGGSRYSYTTTTFGAPINTVGATMNGSPPSGFFSMGINGLTVNAHNPNRQVGGMVGADGKFYSHIVLDGGDYPPIINHAVFGAAGQSTPLEMAGTRVGAQHQQRQSSVSVSGIGGGGGNARQGSIFSSISMDTQQPLSINGVTDAANRDGPVPNVSFTPSTAIVSHSNAAGLGVGGPIAAHRRRTSLFPDKYLKVTDARYATVVLIPMTYGEGAQTFFASTALSRQRRQAAFATKSGRGAAQLPIIYSARQLAYQRLVHLGLDVPKDFGLLLGGGGGLGGNTTVAAVGGTKPRYAADGTYLTAADEQSIGAMLSGATNGVSGIDGLSAVELQAMQQRLALYRAMQQQGQTLTAPQISDMQMLKKKLGNRAASASSTPSNSPAKIANGTRGSSSSVLSSTSMMSFQAAACLSNYDGAATVSADALRAILEPLMTNSLMDAYIQINDVDEAELANRRKREEEEAAAVSPRGEGGFFDRTLNSEGAMNATATFCVDDALVSNDSMAFSLSVSGPGSPLIAINEPHPPPPASIRAANDEVAKAIANDNGSSPTDTLGGTVTSLLTVRNHDKIQPTRSASSRSLLNATTTNLDTAATIDSLYQRATQGKTPRPSDAATGGGAPMLLDVPNATNAAGNSLSAHPSSNNLTSGGNNNASSAHLNLAQRKAAKQSASNMAIQMLFNENKTVAEAFKAAQAAAQAQVAANSAIPNVLSRGVIKDGATRELNYAKKAQEKRKRVAVLIGISKYEDRRIPARDQCVEDIEAMSTILKNIGFRVTVLSTNAVTADGERDPDLYPTKANILKAIAEATKICKNEECIGLVCAFGGGYIGPIPGGGGGGGTSVAAASKDKDATDNAARRMSLAATQAGLSSNTTAVLVPPDVYLGQITAANTISLPDLEICGGGEKGPKNLVYIDTFSVLGLKPCDGKYGGFCQSGGRKSVGSEIVAFYGEQQALLMAYYMKRGFTGYATRDSRITVNGLNAYLTRKLKKYEVLSLQSTASTFYIGDLDLARVHELRYCRHEINEIKAEQFAHFAKVHMMVIPTRNQDPTTVEFIRAIIKKFQKNMKPTGFGVGGGSGPAIVCYSRLNRQRYHFFMRSVLPEKIYLNDASFIAHESKALLQFKNALHDQHLTYQLLCYHSNLAGCLHIKNPVTRREFMQQFDNSDTIRKIKRLKKEAEAEKAQQLQAGRVHHLSKTLGGARLSAQAQLNHLMSRGGAGYLADTFATRFSVDSMAVHQVGVEMMLTFITSEYIANKMDKLVRVGALRQDLITSALMIKPLDDKALHVEKIVTKAQAIVRGYQTRKVFGKIIPMVKSEIAARQLIVEEQLNELLALQRNTFASHCGSLELVESKQRKGWLEEYYDDRSFYWMEYIDSFGRAARKDKIRILRYAEEQDLLYREWFDFRCGFTAFALSLMSAIYSMIRLQGRHDRSYQVILHEEDQARRLLMARWQRTLAGF